MNSLGDKWSILDAEFRSEYYIALRSFLKTEYARQTIYPDMYEIYTAFHLTGYNDVKVVLLGQDPYHGAGQAHGLAFSVKQSVPPPPSLVNIFKEIEADLGIKRPSHGCLEHWARQGVLLLNTALTVREGSPNSHKNKGWEIFTDKVISHLNSREAPLVFMLWGANAKAKHALITNPQHLVLKAAHPSPLSAHNGFFGCKHFSQANDFLKSKGAEPIDWSLK